MDRLERRNELRELLGDRMEGREDLRDLIKDRLERRAALRELIADRMGERNMGGEEYGEEPSEREAVRELILSHIQGEGGLSPALNRLRERIGENR